MTPGKQQTVCPSQYKALFILNQILFVIDIYIYDLAFISRSAKAVSELLMGLTVLAGSYVTTDRVLIRRVCVCVCTHLNTSTGSIFKIQCVCQSFIYSPTDALVSCFEKKNNIKIYPAKVENMVSS